MEPVSKRISTWTGTRANVFFSHCLCCSGLASTKSLTCARIFWKLLWPSSSFLLSLQDAMPLADQPSQHQDARQLARHYFLAASCVVFGTRARQKPWNARPLASTHTVCMCALRCY